MKNFFVSLLHNATAFALVLAPQILAGLQQGPQGGALAYTQAHPWAGLLWQAGAFGATMAVRDQFKGNEKFAQATGLPPKN